MEKSRDRRNILILFAVKPLLVIYMMSWAVTDSVGTQLWIYKTCRVYFNQTGLDVNMLDDEDIDELNFYIYYRRHLPESQSSGKPEHEQQDPGAGE